MAKRFTDTNKYKKPFMRGLQGAYKLLWDFLYHDCDHAGIWIVDFEIAQTYIGADMPVNKADALKFFNHDETRIIEIDGGKKWFIPSFIEFQYGTLSEKNRAHINVITILRKYGLLNADLSIKREKGHISPLQGAKEKEKEKEQEQENGGTGEPSMNATHIVPEMLTAWTRLKPKSIVRKDVDYPALRKIAEVIAEREAVSIYDRAGIEKIVTVWIAIIEFMLSDQFFKDYQITQVDKYLQAITSKFVSSQEDPPPENTGRKSTIQANVEAARQAREILNRKYAKQPIT